MTQKPRWLSPVAWWIWAAGLAVAASRTTNPLLLLTLVAVAGYVVAARRPRAAWGRTFRMFVLLGVAVVLIRVAFGMVFAAPGGGDVLFSLPRITLPVSTGIRIGGDITAPTLLSLLYDGMRLAAILICIGAANSLAAPSRLLKSVPAALYEAGVALIVSLTFAPQIASDAQRLRTAQRLRGRDTSGLRGFATIAVPVLEGALERSIHLAASMDSRGYGRTAARSVNSRRLVAFALLSALVCACVGAYAALDARISTPITLMLLITAAALASAALALAGRARVRTVYRRQGWRLAEWSTAACGLIVATAFLALGSNVLAGPVNPPAWPAVPLIGLAAALLCITPAFTTPLPPDRSAS